MPRGDPAAGHPGAALDERRPQDLRELRTLPLLAGIGFSADVTVYTDGACTGNPGPGGWAAIVIARRDRAGDEHVVFGAEARTTNQRMELTAAIEGLRAAAGRARVQVVSDSLYVVNCFRDRWWARWERGGWLNTARQPVANRDLWERLLAEVRRHETVAWRWVRGHSGDPLNERADRLAREAIVRLVPGILNAAPEKAGRSPVIARWREESPGSTGQGAG